MMPLTGSKMMANHMEKSRGIARQSNGYTVANGRKQGMMGRLKQENSQNESRSASPQPAAGHGF
jgi:hypothetical protein